jgi:ATP-dependent DNA helicase RecQ
MTDLARLLHSTFGFTTFRANQETVCRAVTDGRDALLVMPTGAGKSLCYQLPAIARGGTALVVSPLIALMDDQAGKLSAAGLKVGRIHSGLSREESRQACREYLDGALNFLFIAPERMRVPGFPEMLARRKPSLIAIDEAHCISAWGHDFRPDYRTLGEHLPALRPAPIIALTATATPTVQQDIVAQLHLGNPALFIHGFRRSNLAIEVVEMSKPRRHEFTAKLLRDPAARPAIVYAPSRRAADELAADLARHFSAAAYHAGLDPSVRERVQADFQAGKLEVVVATIAFGMGIDKADVRTVVHTALPASVEAFYQEIGRAGRDGLPSRSVLLYSFVDRKIHESFLDRDYPPATDLARVARILTDEYLMPEPLWRKLKMPPDLFTKAVEKLASQGAAQLDMAGNVRSTGVDGWRAGYESQVAFRRDQIDRMMDFAESSQCRMTGIIRHFGDTADATRPCGNCDICSPATATAQSFRQSTPEDLHQLLFILQELDDRSRSTGKLFSTLADGALRGTAAGKDRKTFDTLLDSLVRAALVTLNAETFTNAEGNVIPYKKASLTHEGREAVSTGHIHAPDILLPNTDEAPSTKASRSRSKSSLKQASSKSSPTREINNSAYSEDQKALEKSLLTWRKEEAKRAGIPEFFILSAAVLHGIVVQCPTSLSHMLAISGIGQEKADRFGAAIIAICSGREVPAEYGAPAQSRPTPRSHKKTTADLKHPVATDKQRTTTEKAIPRPHPIEVEVEFTPVQQQLDAEMRAWRKSESERIGLPQFFVLGSSALRSIVLLRPRSLAQLQSIAGIGPEKAEKFGAAILHLCNS